MEQLKWWLYLLCLFLFTAAYQPPEKSLLDETQSYAAVSHLVSINPGGHRYTSTLEINAAPNMIRFKSVKNRSEPVRIFRYDKSIIWLIHREKRGYEGVKLYQEFKLTNGMGVSSHIDRLMRIRKSLQSPDKLEKIGPEEIDGHHCIRYQKREAIAYSEGKFITSDYWINKTGILIKMTYTSPDFSGVLETTNIRMGEQTEALFLPPADYKKAGHRISWKTEKEKLKNTQK